jgi:hypothetical protein
MKPKLSKNPAIHKERQINSIYELTLPNEVEYSVHVLMVPPSSSSTSPHQIFKKQSQRILNDYQNIFDESKKKQQIYFLISSRFSRNESFDSSSASQETSSASSLFNDGSIIPSDQIFDEFIATSRQNLVSSMVHLFKFLDALRVRMQRTSSRRRWNEHPAIHLTFYSPTFQTKTYEYVWETLLSINPSLESFVDSKIEVSFTDHSVHEVEAEESLTRSSQQIKELDEIFKWNKIRNMNDLERYLLLGGNKKITYL